MVNETGFQRWSGQLAKPNPVVRADLSGRTVLVVGASTGIGLEAARHFASMSPARLILACRSETRGKKALQSIKETTGFKAELLLVELSEFSSVQALADKLDRDLDDLDILVTNAALAVSEWGLTEDGWETTLEVNYLSLSLLCLRLLPKMLKTAEKRRQAPRIVIVTSSMHEDVIVPESWLEAESVLEAMNTQQADAKYDLMVRYPLTKLLNLLFAISLAERISKAHPTVIVNTANPGYCVSELRRDLGGVTWLVCKVMDWLLAYTSEEGARELVWSAVGSSWDEGRLHGAYINHSQVQEPGDFVISEKGKKFRDLLWHDTIKNLSKVDQKIQLIVEQHLLQ
ncbi:hypothetical protein HGRIS_009082 [Hohenbuehelia grisea]|uniref:Uncharacterized protein n=1 Tax=Hohenbuehelia grisea TaxID=104357 RepID=A0ABR3J027_9AGAR